MATVKVRKRARRHPRTGKPIPPTHRLTDDGSLVWKKGVSGNPKGRPKGIQCGRARTVGLLDSFLAQSDTREKILAHFTKELSNGAASFIQKILLPLTPKELQVNPHILAATEIEIYLGQVREIMTLRLKRHPKLLQLIERDLESVAPDMSGPEMTELTPDAMVREMDNLTAPDQ